LVWQDENHPAALYDPASDSWSEAAPPPVGSCEAGTAPIDMGNRLLVYSCRRAAILAKETLEWTEVGIPGTIEQDSAVWTGTDLLVWSRPWPIDGVDVWRWTPPD
jgi:hypothetical protein